MFWKHQIADSLYFLGAGAVNFTGVFIIMKPVNTMQNWDSLCKKLGTETELMDGGNIPEAVMCPASLNGVLMLVSKCPQSLQNSLSGEKSWKEEIHSDKCTEPSAWYWIDADFLLRCSHQIPVGIYILNFKNFNWKMKLKNWAVLKMQSL